MVESRFRLKSKIMINKIFQEGTLLLMVVILFMTHEAFPQKTDSIKMMNHFGGFVTLTNNGISTIPSFTLGKPALIFSMSVGRKISFEPEFRFSLEGKPWMLIFWWRYDLWKSERYFIRLGINSQLNFNKVVITSNGITNELQVANRWLTGDLTQSYFVTKNYSVGTYYMYSRTLEKTGIKDLHYLAFRNNFLNIKLTRQFFMKFSPQIYYLRLGENDGFYVSETLTLAKRNFPLNISSIITTPIKSNVPVNNHLLWNINLTYTFNNEYIRR